MPVITPQGVDKLKSQGADGSKVEILEPASQNELKQLDLRERLEGLRGMTWAYAVLHYTGYSASGASKRFSPPLPIGQDPNNSKIMYQYLHGERAPVQGPRGKYAYDLVAEVDKHPRVKVASRWLDHGLFHIFHPDTEGDALDPFLAHEVVPRINVQFIFENEFPTSQMIAECRSEKPEIQTFDNFLWVCAMFRLASDKNSNQFFPLLRYLIPQAAMLEPVFGYVQAPFLKMLEDFYVCVDEGSSAG